MLAMASNGSLPMAFLWQKRSTTLLGAYAARAGLKRLFTTESTNYTFQPGDGFLLRNLVYVTIMGSIVNIMVSCYANLTLVL